MGCPLKPITTSCAIFSRSVIVFIQRAAIALVRSRRGRGSGLLAAGFSHCLLGRLLNYGGRRREYGERERARDSCGSCRRKPQQPARIAPGGRQGLALKKKLARRRRGCTASFLIARNSSGTSLLLLEISSSAPVDCSVSPRHPMKPESTRSSAYPAHPTRESCGSAPPRRSRSSGDPSPRYRNDVSERVSQTSSPLPAPSQLHNHDPPESSYGQ